MNCLRISSCGCTVSLAELHPYHITAYFACDAAQICFTSLLLVLSSFLFDSTSVSREFRVERSSILKVGLCWLYPVQVSCSKSILYQIFRFLRSSLS